VAFPRKLLHEDEEVILDLRPHWSYFLIHGLVLLAAVVAFVAVAVSISNDAVSWVVGVVVLIALLRLVQRYAAWTTTEFVVTSDRIILRAGIVAKKGMEIPLDRVNTVFFSQKLRERLFGFGDLIIESAGERGQEVINNVAHPEEVQSVIHAAMEREQDQREGARFPDRTATTAVPMDRESVLDQIDRLDQMRQRGVISQAEFETKKAQLLERL
jgi:uncharacterized membrane protein YdbT with pleckstrin-like domain